MKGIKFIAAIAALAGMVACCDNTPKQYTGTIVDASMNTVTVKELTTDATQTFSTEQADMSEANGMLIGSPVVVDYTGKLNAVPVLATKVVTDATYSEAVGKWTTPDPINPEGAPMGIDLQVEGAAQSINMASLLYNNWELQGEANKIILKGVSEGSGDPIEFTQTAVLSKNAEGVWTLAIEGTEVVLTKQAM